MNESLVRSDISSEFRRKRDDVREASCRYTLRGNLRKLFRVHRLPSDETGRQRLGGVDPELLCKAFQVVFAKAQRGKALENLRSVDGSYLSV